MWQMDTTRQSNSLCYEMTNKSVLTQYYRFFWIVLCWITFLSSAHANTTSTIQTLRLGVLPDSDPQIIKQRLSPLLHYIEKQTGLNIELVIPKNYENLVEKFQNKTIDLALFGGYTFIKAQQKAQARAFVMRDIDLQFSTSFLTQANNPKQNIIDFKGAIFSFGSQLSTSGHMMPRFFLDKQNIQPEVFFKEVRYSNAHDTTVYLVRDGHVDLGAVNSDVVKHMLMDKRLNKNEIRIVWKTPTYTDYVWAIQPDFDEILHDRLLDSFLSLTLQDATHQKILESIGARSFLPANNADFESLRQATKIMER